MVLACNYSVCLIPFKTNSKNGLGCSGNDHSHRLRDALYMFLKRNGDQLQLGGGGLHRGTGEAGLKAGGFNSQNYEDLSVSDHFVEQMINSCLDQRSYLTFRTQTLFVVNDTLGAAFFLLLLPWRLCCKS